MQLLTKLGSGPHRFLAVQVAPFPHHLTREAPARMVRGKIGSLASRLRVSARIGFGAESSPDWCQQNRRYDGLSRVTLNEEIRHLVSHDGHLLSLYATYIPPHLNSTHYFIEKYYVCYNILCDH